MPVERATATDDGFGPVERGRIDYPDSQSGSRCHAIVLFENHREAVCIDMNGQSVPLQFVDFALVTVRVDHCLGCEEAGRLEAVEPAVYRGPRRVTGIGEGTSTPRPLTESGEDSSCRRVVQYVEPGWGRPLGVGDERVAGRFGLIVRCGRSVDSSRHCTCAVGPVPRSRAV